MQEESLAKLYSGILRVGTDEPAYPPWYVGDDPANGEGFEKARWRTPSRDNWDMPARMCGGCGCRSTGHWSRAQRRSTPTFPSSRSRISEKQLSTSRRRHCFDVTQVVVTTKASPAASVRSIADLKKVQLGVQVGTTSHTAAVAIDGDAPIEVYNTNADAKVALNNGEIDAVVADLPTAFAVAAELRDGTIVGQLPAECRRRRAVRHRVGQGQLVDQVRIVGRRFFCDPTGRWRAWKRNGWLTRAMRRCSVSKGST